jgi:hypothetical protein
MRFPGRGLCALYGLPARRLAPWRLRPCPRRCQEQQHRGRVQGQRDSEDEIPEHVIVLGAQQGRQIFDRAQVGFDLPALALDAGLFDLQVGKGLRLDRQPVSEAVALGLPSFVVRGTELGDRPTCSRWWP